MTKSPYLTDDVNAVYPQVAQEAAGPNNIIELKNIVKTYKGVPPSPFWQRVSNGTLKFRQWMSTHGLGMKMSFIEKLAAGVPDTKVIGGLDLSILDKPEGEFIVLMGASGCGKSTILKFLADLDTPTSGDVLVNGVPVCNNVRAGMVFQGYSSFPWLTVLDNVALGLKYQGVSKQERRERAMEMIKRVGLAGHEMKYAKSPTLSGGQLQRVAIARSLVANPQVLLMDEPFGALDPKTRSQMQDLLCSLFEEFKFTIILVTHDPREAVYLADDIYIMSKPPATIAHHIKVDLGFHRERSLKRTQAFTDLVNTVDDLMMKMDG